MSRDDWHDPDAVAFADVAGAGDADGRLDLAPVARAAAERDVLLGVFTDEEVHWAGRDPAAAPQAFLDAPRLATYPRAEQDAALTATLWLLRARGEASADPDGHGLALHGAHAVLAELRTDCEAGFSLRVDVAGEGSERAGVYRVRPDLFLCEDVAAEGLHRCTLLSPERQAVWLSATIDRFNLAHVDTGPTHTAESLDELSPHPDELAGRCATAAQLAGTDRDGAERCLTAYTTDDDGLWLLTGYTHPDPGHVEGRVELANPGAAHAVEALLTFLDPPPPDA